MGLILAIISKFLLFLSITGVSQAATAAAYGSPSCRCLPGDACWPSPKAWSRLNATVGGRLIATTLLATPCHDPTYNATACARLQSQWLLPQTHFSSPSSFMNSYFQNASCDPFTPRAKPCTLGNYVDYAINCTGAEDIAAGLRFAQMHNIRLVIKNTGHDYLGKSTGKGALGIWTHNLKFIDIIEYNSKRYSGPAIKIGAGVQAYEAYYAADAHGLRVLGGECPTVGVAGGYTQGGGHSALSSIYGLGADQTLEWEVVTADGSLVIASPSKNPDLYWALSGGGGGTYGVVVSLTSKAHKDGVIGGARLSFLADGISQDKFWNAIGLWHGSLPSIVDKGAMAVYYFTNEFFSLVPLTFPGGSEAEVTALLEPFTADLRKLNISYSLNVTSFPRYLQHYETNIGPLPYGLVPINRINGGRLIPRSVVQNNNAALTATIRNISKNGTFYIAAIALDVSHRRVGFPPGVNAVLPAWRNALLSVVVLGVWDFTLPLEQNIASENELTNTIMPQLDAVAPDSGCYLNEGDFQQRDWQRDFYGSNYERLRRIKRKYDPQNLFYARTAVGSDAWTVKGDGRLCRS